MNQLYKDLMRTRRDLFKNINDEHALKIITNIDEIEIYEKRNNVEIGVLYQDQYIMLLRDLVQSQKKVNEFSTYIRIVHTAKKDGVVILPLLGDKIVCISHFRHSTRDFRWEVPRGFAKDNLTVQENAHSELLEETGYSIQRLSFLGTVYPDTGLYSNSARVYLAIVDEKKKQEPTDKREAIREIKLIPMEQIKRMILSGEITDGYTLSALAMYWTQETV